MRLSSSILVFLLCCGHCAFGQFPYLGKCPSPDVQESFDIGKFSGRWYEVQRTMSFLEVGARCVSTNFSDAGHDDGSIEVVNEGFSPILKLRKSVRLIAHLPNATEPAKFKLRLSDLSLKTNYWILSTDYDNYAIIWACNHIWLTFKYGRTENMWVLARERSLTADKGEKVSELIAAMKDVKAKKLLRSVRQDNCDENDS